MTSNPRSIRVGTALPSALPPMGQVKMARFLEALGYEQLWVPDHLLYPEGSPAYDSWAIMALLASATKSVGFGTAVTDPHRVHPAVLAQRVATLDQLSRGRFTLGLGSGESMNLDPYGIAWKKRKVGKIKEFMTVFRGLLDSKEPFTFEGDFFQLDKAKLSVRPYKKRHIPIYMAALGPQMQSLAGRMADGWYPSLIPPAEYASYAQPLLESALKAGRKAAEISKVATLAVAMDTDGRTSLDDIIGFLRPLSGLLVWPPVMERLGHEFNPPDNAKVSYMEVNPCEPESLKSYSRMCHWMPEPMIKEALTYGTSEQIYQECQSYVEQGAQELCIQFASLDPLGSFVIFAHEVLPRLTGRPATPLARALGAVAGPLIRLGLSKKYFPAPRTPTPEFLALEK